MSNNWRFAYLLPNLNINDPIETDGLAIVSVIPKTDDRLSEIMKSNPIVEHLLHNFTGQFGKKYSPCALIYDNNSPETVDLEALIAFRNVAAISCLCKGWKIAILNHPNVSHPLYSDYFDLYPTTLDKTGKNLVTISPAIMGLDTRWKQFIGQNSPYLNYPQNITAEPEQHIFQALRELWNNYFVNKKSDQETKARKLFRSLEVAYQAARVPIENQGRIFDYGTKMALWVSAFEVLTHNGDANLGTVLNLLSQAVFNDGELNKAYNVNWRNQEIQTNLIGKLYHQLYETRNDFLHGNPIEQSKLFPFNNKHGPTFLGIAPLVYRTSLQCYLKGMKITKTVSGLKEMCQEHWRESGYEDALVKAINTKGDDYV